MGSVNATITYKEKGRVHKVMGQRLIFSAHRCFSLNGDKDDLACLKLLEDALIAKNNLAIAGTGEFAAYFLKHLPQLKNRVKVVVQNDWRTNHKEFAGLPVCNLANIPSDIEHIFIAETLSVERMKWRRQLGTKVNVLDTEILRDLGGDKLPMRAWSKDPDCIYPMEIPDIEFDSGKDFILIDCPARNLALMPNGLAYVHNALKKTSLNFQTVDLDIIAYHRYHSFRLLDSKGKIMTPKGREMHSDPWLAEAYMEWLKEDTLLYFEPMLEEIVHKLIAAKPKILGCSIQGCNINFTREVVRRVKAKLPGVIIVGGGYSAYQPKMAMKLFPEADYICVGEADLTAPPLLEALNRGEFPQNTPGVLSVYDTPGKEYKVGGMPHELDVIEMAKYDWTDLKLYRNHNHYQLTPIIATRGCRWSKCTFCGERFFWRARSPKLVVDEFEYLHDNGCDLFMFNESDLNGNPKILLEICEEIQRRKLKIRLTGQLRISRHSDRKFFDGLRGGGFTALRFGVDAWSENTLKLQKKGYTVPMISQNLKDCWEAGIYTEVNTVIGIPGETDDDIQRTIELKGICKPHIGRVANINKLMLIHGSVYWEEPEKHNIKFRGGTKEELFEKYPAHIPAELWYSEGPYIDEEIRVQRLQTIVKGMGQLGYDVGPFAMQNIEKIDAGHADDSIERKGQYIEFDEKKKLEKKEGPEKVEMRVDSMIPNVVVSTEAPTRIFFEAGEVYGVFPEVKVDPSKAKVPFDNMRGLASPPAHQRIRQISATGYKLWKERGAVAFGVRVIGKGIEAMPHKVQRAIYFARAGYQIYKVQGREIFWFRLSSKLNQMKKTWFAGARLKEGQVEIRRDYSPLIEMIDKHPAGYLVLKVRDTFYGIHNMIPFDKVQADSGEYPAGKCFLGPNARSVIDQIELHTGSRAMPLHGSTQQLALG